MGLTLFVRLAHGALWGLNVVNFIGGPNRTKAIEPCEHDPDGAITAARTFLENVCKHLLEAYGSSYSENDDLPQLYGKLSKTLNIAPSQQSEQTLQRIFGRCHIVIQCVGTLRNQLGDAHGSGKVNDIPTSSIAILSVNLAGTMAMFLVQTSEALSSKFSTGEIYI